MMFSDLTVCVLPNGVGKLRFKALQTQLRNNGATVVEAALVNSDTIDLSYLLVADELDASRIRALISAQEGTQLKVVRIGWLTECLKSRSLLPTDSYAVSLDITPRQPNTSHKQDPKPNDSSKAKAAQEKKTTESAEPKPKRARFVCEKSSKDEAAKKINHNEHITDKLKVLAEGYKSTNDRWRALTYEKAVKTIENWPRRISSQDDVKQLRGVGARLAEKIWEICESGTLRKADEFESNEKVQAMNTFVNIWGVGPTIAEQWYLQGMRTLEHVRERAQLTRQQNIGLKYYEELLQRMPRNEATEIVDIVIGAANDLADNLECVACGSYRRERETCGDVDILVTHPDGQSHNGVLQKLVVKLAEQGFLTDHLVECQHDENQHKYMGVCLLPGEGRLHRRLDIITVPYDEYPTALIYFTGSAHFTRSIYAKAKSMGMRLNQHGLRGGIMRQYGEKLNDGYLIETNSEKEVFEQLGFSYRTPQERDHP